MKNITIFLLQQVKRFNHQKASQQRFASNKTHFGFQTVSEKEKSEKVYQVFENVATKYDLMNDAMSFGIHRLWKDHFVHKLGPTCSTRLIDVAGGTGDIAFRFLKHVNYLATNKIEEKSRISVDGDLGLRQTAHVTVVDINEPMLEVGRQKCAQEHRSSESITWMQGDAENLPIEDNSYDAYTIAFGIRNCTHVDKVLDEAYRVLKPGGRFMCLEFSHVTNPILSRCYDAYSFQVIPAMGYVLAKDFYSYKYLVESIRQFPDQCTFADMIEDAGFQCVTYENLTFGVCAIHSGFKL